FSFCAPVDQADYGCADPASNACQPPNAIGACQGGACAVGVCKTGYGDCNGMVSDGCETNLRTSNTDCGTCGNACTGGPTCQDGTCAATCGPPLTNCGGTCANLLTSVSHCGGCNVACPTPGPGLIAVCMNGSCTTQAACPPGQTLCVGAG